MEQAQEWKCKNIFRKKTCRSPSHPWHPADERWRVFNASYVQDTYLMRMNGPQAYIVQIHTWLCYEVGFYISSLESKCSKATLAAIRSAFYTIWWLTRCHLVSAGRTSRSEPATHSVIPAYSVSLFREHSGSAWNDVLSACVTISNENDNSNTLETTWRKHKLAMVFNYGLQH